MPEEPRDEDVAARGSAREQRDDDEAASSMGLAEAFASMESFIVSAPGRELLPINIDTKRTVTVSLRSLKQLKALWQALSGLSNFDAAHLERLEALALSLAYVDGMWEGRGRLRPSILPVYRRGVGVRKRLLLAAQSLANEGLVGGEPLRELKGPVGLRPCAHDLDLLSILLREAWPLIVGRCALDLKDLEDAEGLALALRTHRAQSRYAEHPLTALRRLRRQAFTRLVQAYNAIRAAVLFLRSAQGDGDQIMPSLYAGRVSATKPSAA